MKKLIKQITFCFLLGVLFTACKKDVQIPKANDTKTNAENTAALASKIESDVNDFKQRFLEKKSNIDGNEESMDAYEAIELIETDLNYTYAETWVAEGIVNNPYKHTFGVTIPSNGEFDGEDIYNIYHTALNDIIETNNNLTQPDKKLTWVDMELKVGPDGNAEVILVYLMAYPGVSYAGPGPLQTFNYSGYWHWNLGGAGTALGYFNNHGDVTPVAGQYGGGAPLINNAAQNNYNYYKWLHNLTGYYVGNTTYYYVNYHTSPYYFNSQIAQWRTLAYVPGMVNVFAQNANNNSPAANVYHEASYRANFQEPSNTATSPPNGHWWDFDRECLPDYALNFYTERFVDLAKDVMPTTGILGNNEEIYSFDISGVHTHTTIVINPQPPNVDEVALNHVINFHAGTFVGYARTNLPASIPTSPTLVP